MTVSIKPYTLTQHPDNYIHKGEALAALHQYEAANKLYDVAIRLGVEDCEVFFCKSAVLEKLGQHEQAEIYWERGQEGISSSDPTEIDQNNINSSLLGENTDNSF